MVKLYKIIYADPAWVYQDKSKSHGGGAESHYECTPTEEMGKIPINADKDSVCLMWVTYPQLEEGLKLMSLWGFKFKTVAFTWVKKNSKSEGFFFGMGRYTRANPEICLLGVKGKGVTRVSASIPNLQIYPRGEHSQKPRQIKEQIVKLFGDLPRIELFARETTEGWDVFGKEVTKYSINGLSKDHPAQRDFNEFMEKQKEVKSGENANDGIPPNNKLLGILPTIL